jgi:phage tail tape-measure protein
MLSLTAVAGGGVDALRHVAYAPVVTVIRATAPGCGNPNPTRMHHDAPESRRSAAASAEASRWQTRENHCHPLSGSSGVPKALGKIKSYFRQAGPMPSAPRPDERAGAEQFNQLRGQGRGFGVTERS